MSLPREPNPHLQGLLLLYELCLNIEHSLRAERAVDDLLCRVLACQAGSSRLALVGPGVRNKARREYPRPCTQVHRNSSSLIVFAGATEPWSPTGKGFQNVASPLGMSEALRGGCDKTKRNEGNEG